MDQSEAGAAKSEMAKHELYGAHAIMKALFAVFLSLPSLFAKLGSRRIVRDDFRFSSEAERGMCQPACNFEPDFAGTGQGYPMLTGIALSHRTGDRIMITGR